VRAAGKKLIGAQASAAIWAGVDEWLRRNPRKSVTDFVIEASMEKLDHEKIPYDRAVALFDGRRRNPSLPTTGRVESPHVLRILRNRPGKKKSGAESSKQSA
jgi:hypothetical protein